MNKRVDTIIEEARKLTLDERAELMRRLPIELEDDAADGTVEEVEAAWIEEVERRIDKAERGRANSVDLDEVLAKARERLYRR